MHTKLFAISKGFIYSYIFILLYHYVNSVDRNKFKTCEQTSFCKEYRNFKPESSLFKVITDSLNITKIGVEGALLKTDTLVKYSFLIQFLVDSTIRLRINEENVIRSRYQPLLALVSEPVLNDGYKLVERNEQYLILKRGSNKLIIHTFPFKLELFNNDRLVIIANDLGRFVFEPHSPTKPESTDKDDWVERFHEFVDSRPFGPMAVAMDFSFPSSTNVYGLPSHADLLSLRSTSKIDPYRLYNLDVFEYETHETMSLYGAVPFIIAHGLNDTVGLFWLNSAETWVDIDKQIDTLSNTNVMEKIVNLVSGSTSQPHSGINTYFMSETGIVDVFFVMGPSSYDVTRQYSRLTGSAPVPPYFAIGYHQSRWNYNDQDDVKSVSENFDKYDIPLDVMWLDIEYTHDRKYFTWDPVKFSDPENMVNVLAAKGRKLVVLIDGCHVKRENGYTLHEIATQKGYYVKNKDRNDYEGWCWPGASSYMDFLNPEVGSYYSTLNSIDNFKAFTNDVHIWNDMNEPSVFNGPEVTMPKDCIHYGDWEHRDVHNIYGLFQVVYTFSGMLKRTEGTKRPFILSRAHFAGIQRYAAIWTGDNAADWEHLKISVPMCLSSALGGISFCGADVGGFFKNPDKQLLVRWYQLGAYYPFFRAHAHIETKRREPWLFDKNTLTLIRAAVRERQALLPFWYTLFYEHSKTGVPVIRPLFMEFPKEQETFDNDVEFLLGKSILIRPVTEPDVTKVDVYFPGQNEIWYNKNSFQQIKENGLKSIQVTENEIPVYIRGGSIIPMRNRIRRSALLTFNDPYTLIVALDMNGSAEGHLYVDDGESYEYKEGKYLYLRFAYLNNQLLCRFASESHFESKAWIEKVIIIGIPDIFRRAIVHSIQSDYQEEVDIIYSTATHSLTIRKPAVAITEEWTISLH